MSWRHRNISALAAAILAVTIATGAEAQERAERPAAAERRAARAAAAGDRALPGGRASAAPPRTRAAYRQPGQGLFLPDMSTFDANGDGSLSRAEFETAARELFGVYDANADGKLEQDEMQHNLSALWLEPPVRADQILRLYDLNDDRKIAPEECLLPSARFKELDKDNTGALENGDLVKLSLTQAALLIAPERRGALLLALYDTNKDGRLTQDEIKTDMSVLKVADTNADGILDPEEIKSLPPLPPEHPHRQALGMIAQYDEDGDKMLAENEFRRARIPFDSVDGNKDGLLDVKELAAWIETGGGRGTRAVAVTQMVQNVISRYDKNNDGKVTKDEQLNMPEALWARWDSNGDGTIDAREIEDSMTTPRFGGPRPGAPVPVAPGGAPGAPAGPTPK